MNLTSPLVEAKIMLYVCPMSLLLAIESSCDDTGASVIRDGEILSNVVASQSVHEAWGGVVPELASRAHQQQIVPVVHAALEQAHVSLKQLEGIAFTAHPGLIGSLLVGSSYAKSLAQVLQIPLMAINHMEAHVLALFIGTNKPIFPFICLTVSGGHTQLVLMKGPFDSEILGETLDDAAGEAFDKGAKMLGLPYPGGPLIDRLAQSGNPKAFEFARPDIPGLNFSFSGLKTSLLYFLRDQEAQQPGFTQTHLNDICASYQFAIIRHILDKTRKAMKETGIKQLGIAGGVAANKGLREALQHLSSEKKYALFVPEMAYCTDNAAMIAMAAHFKFEAKQFVNLEISPSARYSL